MTRHWAAGPPPARQREDRPAGVGGGGAPPHRHGRRRLAARPPVDLRGGPGREPGAAPPHGRARAGTRPAHPVAAPTTRSSSSRSTTAATSWAATSAVDLLTAFYSDSTPLLFTMLDHCRRRPRHQVGPGHGPTFADGRAHLPPRSSAAASRSGCTPRATSLWSRDPQAARRSLTRCTPPAAPCSPAWSGRSWRPSTRTGTARSSGSRRRSWRPTAPGPDRGRCTCCGPGRQAPAETRGELPP